MRDSNPLNKSSEYDKVYKKFTGGRGYDSRLYWSVWCARSQWFGDNKYRSDRTYCGCQQVKVLRGNRRADRPSWRFDMSKRAPAGGARS